jgi:hypothetical protein
MAENRRIERRGITTQLFSRQFVPMNSILQMCAQGDSNSQNSGFKPDTYANSVMSAYVPLTGIEPALPTALVPKTSVSTYSTTGA